MDHGDHLNLLRKGVTQPGGVWADFGAGTGAFTLALAELIGADGEIYAVDQDAAALRSQAETMRRRFPGVNVHHLVADFTAPLGLPPLDGIVAANALHFQQDQEMVVQLLRGYLRPGGRFLIVEYNIERGNFAVPHPIPYTRWVNLAQQAGFSHISLLATRPSRFLREIYSAVSHG